MPDLSDLYARAGSKVLDRYPMRNLGGRVDQNGDEPISLSKWDIEVNSLCTSLLEIIDGGSPVG
jgi:hypothetical protein